MDKTQAKIGALFTQELALSAYLDGLLNPSAEVEVAPAPVAELVSLPSPVPTPLPTEPAVKPGMALVPTVTSQVVVTPAPVERMKAVPEWAERGFECLLFFVGGLKLAVPLVKLTRIIPWGEHVTQTPGRPPWFMGLMPFDGRQTGIIDTAKLVFPRDRLSQREEQVRNGEADGIYSRILMVENGRWGLCCDRVDAVVSLQADAVRWRTERTSRRWLAGTVTSQMCALLDIESLAAEITQSGRGG